MTGGLSITARNQETNSGQVKVLGAPPDPDIGDWVHYDDAAIVFVWLTDYEAWFSYVVLP